MRYEMMRLQIRGPVYIIPKGYLGDSSQRVVNLKVLKVFIHFKKKYFFNNVKT